MKLPDMWRQTTIEELCTYYSGGEPFNKLEYATSGIPVLAKGDIKQFGRIEHSEKRYITAELAKREGFRLSQPGDFLLTTRDLTQAADVLGLVAPIPSARSYVVNQGANTIRLNNKVDPRYFVYWTNGPEYRKHIKAHFVGSTQIHLRKQDFLDAPIYLPPLPEQRAIAAILGSLDDKIELNRRMNQTLEQMAQALFKSWFVDFDPVHANRNGEALPGLAPEVQALFPDAFAVSDLGEVPAGWRVKKLSDAVQINPPRRLQKGDVAPYLDMANMPTSSPRAQAWFDRPYNSGARFMNGDVLLARITPCLENGKTAFVDFLGPDQIGWGSTEYIVLSAIEPLPYEYIYFVARDNDFRAFAIQNMTGTSGRQRVPVNAIAAYHIVVPDGPVLRHFGECTVNAFAQMKANDEQSRTIAAIRDALLPKLLSGEVRVRDAERIVAEVA